MTILHAKTGPTILTILSRNFVRSGSSPVLASTKASVARFVAVKGAKKLGHWGGGMVTHL